MTTKQPGLFERFLSYFFHPVSTSPFVNSGYRPDIDGLRAIAIVAVVFFHAFPETFQGGFVGVDIFFVISGFLITGIIFRGLKKGSFSFKDFYARRIRRIFPALMFLIVVLFLTTAPIFSPNEYRSLALQTKYGTAFFENYLLFSEADNYWAQKTEMMPLMHLWTLAVEEQFYIVLPPLLYFLWKFKPSVARTAIWLLTFISFLLAVSLVQSRPVSTFYLLHTRFWELGLGAILAVIFLERPCLFDLQSKSGRFFVSNLTQNTLSFIGVSLVVASFAFINSKTPFPGIFTLLPTLGAALIIASPKAVFNRYILSCRPFVFIGLISYTWYLWHWPVLSVARVIQVRRMTSLQ